MSSTADDAVEDGSTDDRQKTQVDESSEIDKSPNLKADNEEPIGQVEEVLASNGISRSEDIPENMALETPADENRDSPGAAGQGNQASENSEVHQDSKNDRRGSRTSQTSEKNDRRGSRTSQKGEVQQISAERNGSNVDGRRQSQTSQKSQGKQHAALHTDAKESHKGAVRRSPTGETSQKSEIFDTANQSDRNSDSGEKSEVFDGTASVKTKTEYRRDSQISEKSEVHIDSALVGDESAMASPEDYHTKRFEKADDLDPEEQVDHTVLGAPEASLVKRIEVADEIDAVDDAPEEVAKQRETQESGVTVGLAWPTINDERASSDGEKDGSNNGDDRADDAARNIGENNTDPSNDRFTVKRTSVAKRNSVTSKDTRRTSHVVKARTFCEEVKGGVPQKKRTLWGRVMGESPPKNDAPKKSFFNFGKSQVKAQSDSNNPPGSVSITIVGTEGFPNLKKKQKSTRHCVCDVIGSKSGPFKTPKVENVANPTWNHPVRVLNYHRMSCIQFAIIDDDIIGLGCLNTSDFYPNGFKGSLDLRDNDDKPIKAKLKLIVNAKPPLKGEGENEDGGQGGFQDEVSDQIMAKFTCADDHGPNDFLTRSANRRARVVHVTSDAEEEDVDALLRTPISSEFEESSEDNREDADVEKDRCTLDANEDDEDEETLKARNRAACNIAGMELRGHREETDPLRGLPYHLGSRGWEPHLVWVCGQKVKPANFSDAVHKQLALAALSAGTTSVQANIKRLRGAREGGWQLRWDCAASCKVDGPAPRRVNDKFTTKRVTNTPMPTWNEQCDFPDVMQDATLEFAVEGIDRDGWPKRDAILGRIGLPKESIGDQGFDGELKLQGTKHGVDANLQVEIAVLALWDDEADERVPLHETRAALQRMDDIWSKSWAAPLDLEDDSRNYGPEENTWEELDLGPCTVYDLLYADAHRRKCHKKLNNDIDVIKVTSPVKKKEWVWKEVQNFFTRIYDDEDSVKKSLDVAPVPMVAKDPRPHLSCVSHPDDAAASHHDLGNVELANIRPEKLIRKDFSSSSEESEEWENGSSSSSSSSSSSNSRSRKRANIRAGGAKRISPVFEKTLQQLAEKQRMSQGKEMNASRRQTHQQTRNANSTIEEQIRRATHHGPTSRYKETRPLLQAKGIRPSELANHDSTSSAEELEPGTRSLDIAEARGRHANTTKKVVNARSAVAPKANNLKQQKTLRSRMEEQRIEIGTDGNNISHVTSARPNQPRSHQALDVIDESALLGHVPRLSEINMDLDIKCVDMDGRPDRDRRINTALVLDTEVAPHSVKEVVRTFQPGKMGFANRGAIVEKVHAGGQAEREGVKVGWRIIKVGDQACETFDDKAFQDAKAGDIPFQVTFVKGSVKVEDAGKGSPIANKDKQLNTRGHTSTQLKVLKDMLEIQEELSPRPDTLEVTESPQSSEKSPKEKKNKKDKRVATDSSESPNEKKTKKEKKEKKSKKQDDEAEEENQYYAEPDHRAREDDAEDEALQEKKNKKDKKEKKTKKEYSSPDEKEVKKEKKSRKDKKEKRNEGLAGGAVVVGARIDTGLGPHSRASVARQSMPGTRQSVAQRQSVTASRQSIRQSVSAQRNSVAAAPQATKLKSPQRQSLTAARQSATTQKVISPSTQSLGRSATAPLRPSANTPRQSITTRGTTQFTYPVYRSSVKSITQDSDGFLEL